MSWKSTKIYFFIVVFNSFCCWVVLIRFISLKNAKRFIMFERRTNNFCNVCIFNYLHVDFGEYMCYVRFNFLVCNGKQVLKLVSWLRNEEKSGSFNIELQKYFHQGATQNDNNSDERRPWSREWWWCNNAILQQPNTVETVYVKIDGSRKPNTKHCE